MPTEREHVLVKLSGDSLKGFSPKAIESANKRIIAFRAPKRFSDAGFPVFVSDLEYYLKSLEGCKKPRAFIFDLSSYELPAGGPDDKSVKRVFMLIEAVLRVGHRELAKRIAFSFVVAKNERIRSLAKEINSKVSPVGNKMVIFDDFAPAASACAKRIAEERKNFGKTVSLSSL